MSNSILSASSYTLFQEDWWLEAVAPDEWSEVNVDDGGKIIARFPFVVKKKYGVTALTAPKLTPYLGPWYQETGAKHANSIAVQMEMAESLICKLPKFDLFRQNFCPEAMNWLPFYWKEFNATPLYTYRLLDLRDEDSMWNEFRDSVRREIRKAKRKVEIIESADIDVCYELIKMTYLRQNRTSPISKKLLYRIEDCCKKRDVRRVTLAVDEKKRCHAFLYAVWDSRATYYIIGGGDPKLRNSGAMSLLMWDAIKFAATKSQIFDFEGSMIKPIERFFRGFGGTQVPYLFVSKTNKVLSVVNEIRALFK